jgi:hypothetical protein
VKRNRRAEKVKQRFDPETGALLSRIGRGNDYYGYYLNERTGQRFYYSKQRDPVTDEPILKAVRSPMSASERSRRTIKPKDGNVIKARKKLLLRYRRRFDRMVQQFWKEFERDMGRLDQ